MTENKHECEQGFLKGCRDFYDPLSAYSLQQVLKERLENSYGENSQNALEELMTELIESGKDKSNFCKIHQYKFGIGSTPLSEQIPKMDTSLCNLLLQNATDTQKKPLLNSQERKAIEELKEGRNNFGHMMDTSITPEEYYISCWEKSKEHLEYFTNTKTLMKHIPNEMQKLFDDYKQGRGTYTPPTKNTTSSKANTEATHTPSSKEIEDTFKKRMAQHKINEGLQYLFQHASNSLLEKLYREVDYSYLMQKFLDLKLTSEDLYWKKKCIAFAKNNYKYAEIYASTLTQAQRWIYLESYAKNSPAYTISIYEMLYQENQKTQDRRRYDRARLAFDSSIRERCIAQLAEHYQDLENIPLENWLSHTEHLQPILSLMAEEDQQHFRQKTLDAQYLQLGYNPKASLSEQVEWFFHSYKYKKYYFKEESVLQTIFPSICEKFLREELLSLTNALDTKKIYKLPKYFETKNNSPADLPDVLTTHEAYKEWLHFYKVYCAERNIHPKVNFLLDKARNLQKVEKSILNNVASMKPSLEKLKLLEDISKAYKADWQTLAMESDYFKPYPMFTKAELIEQTGHSSREYLDIVSSARELSREIYSSAEKLYKETKVKIETTKKRKKIFLLVASIATACILFFSTRLVELKKANTLYEEGKLIEAYKIYDKKSKTNKDIEQKRIQCLADIRQTMLENGFRQDILSTEIDHSHDHSAMMEQGSYYTDRTDITFVASRNIPVYRNVDGSYQILMGSYWGELRVPTGLELMAIWKSDRWPDKFCVSAICSDGTRLYGESEWITTGHPSAQIESNQYAAEQGMDMNISEESISIKDIILTPDEVYFWTTDNQLLNENASVLYENVAVVELAPYNEFLLSAFSSDGGRIAPILGSFIDNIEAKDIADYYTSSSYITKDGRLVKDDQWQKENDWLFYDDAYTPISVYDASIAEYLE